MWMIRLRKAKNRKGMTLAEVLAAVVITGILASVLTMMLVPVFNLYSANRTKKELASAVTARLNDVAYHLRGATGVYLSTGTMSFPDIRTASAYADQFKGVRDFEAKYGFAMDDYYYKNDPKTKGYLYPELKIAEYADVKNPKLYYPGSTQDGTKNPRDAAKSGMGAPLDSDDYQNSTITCPNDQAFYFYVRENPDNGNRANVLEVHLEVTKNGFSYHGVKTIVCENLVINDDVIYKANFTEKDKTGKTVLLPASVSKGKESTWTKYYSVWFSKKKQF